jgi:hypothetical protein
MIPLFDDLRPYRDDEIGAAMHRIADSEHLPELAAYVFPGAAIDSVRQTIRGIATIDDFQMKLMRAFNDQVMARSTDRLSTAGLDRLDTGERYLFISNHRDIMLDAMFFQYALHLAGHRTSEISFGNNLMSSQLAIDIGRSNKMFKVMRGGNIKEAYANALHLSEYIRHTIGDKRESVWIAQRNGRTKDGFDKTDSALVKMFCMSAPDDPVRTLASLHIVPVAISYEWETCDREKATELCRARRAPYVKQPGEDRQSILTGIVQRKGEVHVSVGSLLTEEILGSFDGGPANLFFRRVASWIDRQIITNYRLTCNNYIAHDLRSGNALHADRYTADEKAAFVHHYQSLATPDEPDGDTLRDIFLGIYANPVDAAGEMN